ncbi:MAG: lamin tail domain-containing protein [Roseibacillus sp.]
MNALPPLAVAILLPLSFTLFASISLSAQDLRINEFMAANDTVYPDNADFDDYSDWIELHNTTGTAVSLDGYYLTDDLTAPTKWAFPAGSSIEAGGFLIVRADGFDAGPGESFSRGYHPFGTNFTTRNYHASFKLSSEGEAVGLFRSETPPAEVTLIEENADWKYLDLGTDPGANWNTVSFDDGAWSSGPAPLGYGDSFIATTVDFGPDSSEKFATTHFRHHFTVTDAASITHVQLRLQVDDSAVVYLNGMEVARPNMPTEPVSYLDYSGKVAPNEDVLEVVELSGFPLVEGDNVLAVEVHQESGTSSDIALDAELIVEVITSPAILLDSVTYGPQISDVSFGRDSGSAWKSFGEPTPAAGNTTPSLLEPFATAPEVTASVDSGFYSGSETVTLASPGTGTIHYTLDGSNPTVASPVYSAGIVVTETTILRARVFEAGLIPGPILLRSYFLGADATPQLPVFSFVGDPETLFGDDIGIYENDTPYVFKGREVPIQLEFFEQDQSLAFAINAGARIGGENIWTKAQKPFNVYCRGKYGDDFVPYQLFPNEAVGIFGEFSLRNGGDDWEETLMRDGMMAPQLRGQVESSLYSYRPSALFLNGDFWGIYNIRKRLDEVSFAQEQYLSEADYDVVQWGNNENGDTVLQAETGTTERYLELLDFLAANDESDPVVYAQIEELVNVDSFIDYVVATDFAVNTSWSHNREFWSGKTPGSKWQWIINDFDRGFSVENVGGSLIDNFRDDYTFFRALDNNDLFVDRLIQRYAAHVGSTFFSQRFDDVLEGLVAEQEGEIARHIARWSAEGGISSATKRLDEIAQIKQFVVDRPANALSRLQLELGISRASADLTLTASPAAGGSIELAGVPLFLSYNNVLSLFQDTPVEVTAVAAPGFAFSSWSNGSTDATIEVTLTGALALTANFLSGAETVLGTPIAMNTTLISANSPYVIEGDLVVEAGATLTIEEGVTVLMTKGSSVRVYGTLDVNGTEAAPVSFLARDGGSWGNIGFVDTTTTSEMSHVIIRNATVSGFDPLNLKGAISGYNATIALDHLDIVGPSPVFARFGSTTLLESEVFITFTGDGINVKSGDGWVEGCTFTGNTSVDTDAIDFDGVTNGVIRDNRIYAFRGDNSDGVDVGEGCVNLLLEGNRIYNNSDKGVSVGQGSEVVMRQNLIVGCDLGVGVKDAGSTVLVDQNTFSRNTIGVWSYEKNLGAGGGAATVTNCIFSASKDTDVLVDSLSMLSASYCLSDTLPIAGSNNFVGDPQFTNAGIYDFSLLITSPAIDAGDPTHALDPDSTQADMGMAYIYDPLDYPFLPPNSIVINELLSNSAGLGDWIELYNSSTEAVDLGGWYLSDSGTDLQKYRIADGTILEGGEYVVFTENQHFGETSSDIGVISPFALSANGETAYVYKPAVGLDLEYLESEDFGAASDGVTFGRYFKESSGTFNFVAMSLPTFGAVNAFPEVGPIVMSEIMYHPELNSDAEYLELLNISNDAVTLYDAVSGEGWAFTNGITYSFPTSSPVTLQAGGRLILTRNIAVFNSTYGSGVPVGTQILQWTAGGLSNGGESLQLSKPGGLDDELVRQFIRVDRVNYLDELPWPSVADGGGPSLERINVFAYGNDSANWAAEVASPGSPEGLENFTQWASDSLLPAGLDDPYDDADGDGLNNLLEYALGTPPLNVTNPDYVSLEMSGTGAVVDFTIPVIRDDLLYGIEASTSLESESWSYLAATFEDDNGNMVLRAVDTSGGVKLFFRLVVMER